MIQIYDRYNGDSEQANAHRRRDLILDSSKALGCMVVWLAMLAILWSFSLQEAFSHVLVFGALVVIVMVNYKIIRPLHMNDLYTFGYDGRDFAILGVTGRVRRKIALQELTEIAIDPAWQPVKRTRAESIGRWGRNIQAVPFGKKYVLNGKKCFIQDPMVLLKSHKVVNRGLDRVDIHNYPQGGFLYNNIGFVLRGENRRIFVQMLKDTACPIVIKADFYAQHREMLNALFARSGMDMTRLKFEGD